MGANQDPPLVEPPAYGWKKVGVLTFDGTTSSESLSITDDYDIYRCEFQGITPASDGILSMRVNGDSSSNYDSVDHNDNSTNGSSRWDLADDLRAGNSEGFGWVNIAGNWTAECTAIAHLFIEGGDDSMHSGNHRSISSPLNEIEVREQLGSNLDNGNVVVFGRYNE